MNTEPTDLRLPVRTPSARAPINDSLVLDDAFASLTDTDLRLDTGVARTEEAGRVAPELLDSLRGQLEAIEAQRGTLQRLLDGLGQ